MNAKSVVIPVAALALALGSFADAAAQSAERRNRGSQRQERSAGDASARPRGDQGDRSRSAATRRGQGAERTERAERVERSNRGNESQDREGQRASASARQRDTRDYRGSNERARTQGRDDYRSNDRDRARNQDRRGGYDRGDSRDYRGSYSSGYSRGYYAPRRLQYRSAPRYYRPGGRLTLYFGIGSGYRYGSPYSGRVYGYRRSVPTYGNYVAYGDLRLKVSPRHASVYVDGYYAGVVDDFDGFFQRLTLEVGPHEIEVEAPGYGSQVFDVYVDPERTIDLHADLDR